MECLDSVTVEVVVNKLFGSTFDSSLASWGRTSCVVSTSLIGLLFASPGLQAQSPPNPNFVRQPVFATYGDFKAELLSIVGISDPGQRERELNAFWTTLQNAGQVPYAQGNQFAFLYRGSGSSVSFPGDLNSWDSSSSSAQATNFAGTNLWIREGTLPSDARSDYKIVLNGNWILDPANPLQMWGGFGPNNELRMPSYVFPQETVRNPAVPQGALTGNVNITSTSLGYNLNYRVYTPAGYDTRHLSDLPVVYVTDGQEYLADYLGSMPIVLDNLTAAGQLRPTIGVFIDPRQPSNPANNRRMSEYNMNPNFANFVANELVPVIDSNYRTNATAEGRTILGTSMGGLNAAYFGAVKGDVFHNIAPQSPAYNVNPAIYSRYQNNDLRFLDLYQTNGTLGNDQLGANQMANIWTAGGYHFSFTVANEGHSWGQWRGQLDDILIALIGPPLVGDYNGNGSVDAADYTVWRDSLGSTANLAADGNGSGSIDIADYEVWQSNFGNHSGSGAGANAAVPEPSTLLLLLSGILTLWTRRCPKASKSQENC
jgi:enterochelin esterase-like enzyme